MTTESPTWIARAVSGVERLAARPWLLFAFVAALHVLTRPYAGIIHDAQLYAGQTLHRVDPMLLADDLFFQFGSQDRFSVFSLIAAPWVWAIGLEAAFFVLYVACDLLFLLALARFLRALMPEPRYYVPALLLAATAPIAYGGQQCFHVHEPFLTPRLPATALALEALTRAMQGRWLRSIAFLALSGLLHPLMAAPAAAVAAATWTWQVGGGRALAALIAATALGFGVVLGLGFGDRLFGVFDPEWRDIVMQATSAHFPQFWAARDWLRIAIAASALVGFVCFEPDAARRRMAISIGIVGLAGLAGSILFSRLAFALPMQVQCYRALWMLMLLQGPMLWFLAVRCAEATSWVQWLSPACIAALTMHGMTPLEWLVPCLLWPLAMRRIGRHASEGLSLSLVISGGLFSLLPAAYLATNFSELMRDYDFRAWYGLTATTLCGLPLLLLLLRIRPASPAWGIGAVAATLAWFVVPQSVCYQDRLTPDGASVRFVRAYFEEHAPDRPLAVYSDGNRLHRVWLDWPAQSWFDTWQSSGFVFTRATAIEGKRRAEAIAPLAMPAFRKQRDRMTADFQRDLCRLTGRDFDAPLPTADDLRRLCQAEAIDFLVLSFEVSDLADATDGQVWIYDARKLRDADRGLRTASRR